LLYVSRAEADCAKAVAEGCLVGERGAGEAGPGDAVLDGGCFCKWVAPPHCDMKDRTAADAVLVQLLRDTTGPAREYRSKVRTGCIYLPLLGRPMVAV
jgi:hypothetical protein